MTLVNFRARNHPQQIGSRGADDATDDRRTPEPFWSELHARFCFTIDAAASAENAKLPRYFDIENSALVHQWCGRVWCNPPYSNLREWVKKAWREMGRGCELIVMLVPANRTEQGWWQEHIEPFRDQHDFNLRVEFLAGRMRFNRPGWTKPAKGDRPPFGLALLIWKRRRIDGDAEAVA